MPFYFTFLALLHNAQHLLLVPSLAGVCHAAGPGPALNPEATRGVAGRCEGPRRPLARTRWLFLLRLATLSVAVSLLFSVTLAGRAHTA